MATDHTLLILLLSIASICGVLADAGQSSPLILGGRDAKPGEFPYQVSIQTLSSSKSKFSHHCGGSIISSLWILTAACCLQIEVFPYRVVAGIIELNGTNPERQERNVTKLIQHPNYVFPHPEDDIGLIELEKPLEFSKFITIQLPKAGLESEGQVEFIGWGVADKPKHHSPNMLKALTTNIIPPLDCKKRYPIDFKRKTHICTGSDLIEGGCFGDSGGPLIQNHEVIGIASFIFFECGNPILFTKVSCYIDFISKHVKIVEY